MRNEGPGWCAPTSCPACVEIDNNGISHIVHSCIAASPVGAAIGLGACDECEALRGDPCRAPSGRTRMPHAGRARAKEQR